MKPFFIIPSGKIGWQAFFLSRIVAGLLVGAVVLTALFKIALPLFVSTASVRTNMENVLSAWTGARANISGDPQISFWPHPVLTLRSVTFEGGDAAAPQLLAKADAIAAGFDILAALRGTPVFYDFHLVNPVFKVERRLDGTFNWKRAGWMADAIADASGNIASPARDTPIGDIEIVNGTVDLIDRVTARTHHVSGISGTIEWPAPTAPINATLSAVMNAEKVSGAIACDEPLMLFSGKNSAIQATFNSPLLTFSFKGTGNASLHPFASGQLQLTAKSFPALAAWAAGQAIPRATTGTASIDTSMTLSGETLKMDNLALSLDGANATGVLDIAWKHPNEPRIDGTLAFDRMDLAALIASFLPPQPLDTADAIDMTFLRQARLDLRLSAQDVSYGPLVLTDVAAGVMAEGGRASVDIGDGTYAGGSIGGRFSLANDGADGGQLQISLKDADLAPVARSLGLAGPLPLGRGLLSVDLSTAEPLSKMTLGGLSGEIRYSAGNGSISDFNAAEFERLATQGRFFNMAQAGDGSFTFTTAEIIARLRNGSAELDRAEIRGEGRTISLAGVIPYGDGGLALAGSMRTDAATTPAIRFFAGGSWPNPVISPLEAFPAQP